MANPKVEFYAGTHGIRHESCFKRAMIEWFYAHGDDTEGPVDGETFNALQAKGVIYQDTLVIQAGMHDWVPLSKLMKTRQMIPVVQDNPPEQAAQTGSAASPEVEVPGARPVGRSAHPGYLSMPAPREAGC